MNSITKPILLFHLFLSVIVAVDVTCDSVNPMIQSDVACTCKTAPGTDIDWYLDDAFHSSCVLSSICIPKYSGYSYSMNTTENVYMMTIHSYDYSNCTKITCKDTYVGSIKQSIIPSSLVFDTTFPTSMTEPGSNNSNGIISVTTGCISGFLDVQYDWYIIVDGLEERYSVYDKSIIDTIDNSSCVNCYTDVNGQRTIGFEHSEASGYETKTGLFKVSLYHVSANLQLNLTSRYHYTVKVNKPAVSDGPPCDTLCIVLICFGIVLLFIICVVIIVHYFVKVCLKDVCDETRKNCVKCNIRWAVEGFDKPEPFNKSDDFLYNVLCCSKEEQVHKREMITDSSYIIPDLYPDRSYTVYVYAIYHSITLKPPGEIKLAQYKPRNLQHIEKSTVIEVEWSRPEYTCGHQLQYLVTCNKIEVEKINFKTACKITGLVPGKTYTIRVFALINSMKSQPLVEKIITPPLKVCLEDVCYEPGKNCLKCNIRWAVEDFDKPEPFNKSDDFLYNVICCSGEEQVHTRKMITKSNYTIPDLCPDRSYSIYVYAIYKSETLEPPGKIKLAPYKPTKLKNTAKSTQIELKWEKPDYAGNQELEYEVTCDKIKKMEANIVYPKMPSKLSMTRKTNRIARCI